MPRIIGDSSHAEQAKCTRTFFDAKLIAIAVVAVVAVVVVVAPPKKSPPTASYFLPHRSKNAILSETFFTRRMNTFSRIATFIHPFRWKLLGLIGLTGVLSIVAMLPPLLTRAIINRVIEQGRHNELLVIGVLMIAAAVVASACGYLQTLGTAYIGQTFVMRVRCAVYDHMLNLGVGYFARHPTGMLINRLMGDSTVLQQMLSATTVQIVSDLVCAAFAITATLFINWRLALPLFLLLFMFVINYRLNIQRMKRLTHAHRASEDRMASGVQNRLAANLTVKTYGNETYENAIFEDHSNAAISLMRDRQIAGSNFSLNTALLRDIGRVVIFFLGCAMVLNGSASYGDVTAFTAYSVQLLWPAVRFSELAQQLENVRISAERLFETLNEAPTVVEAPTARAIPHVKGNVTFTNVSFAYIPEKPVLENFSLTVNAGETIALVGPTGCGKTTLLSLLMRLYDIDSGAITIDGTPIQDFTLLSLRRQFGIVLQESMLFTVSIADNIRYARPEASLDDVINACKIAEIHDDILALPQGYHAKIGSRDVQFSVGQKQRLAIARAVLANPAILVMDEATSALDTRSERAIQLAMNRFLHNRTAFIVAHRLTTIRNAHQIVLIDKGRIIEHGNHDTLMSIPNGRYRHLFETYSGKGIIEETEE